MCKLNFKRGGLLTFPYVVSLYDPSSKGWQMFFIRILYMFDVQHFMHGVRSARFFLSNLTAT